MVQGSAAEGVRDKAMRRHESEIRAEALRIQGNAANESMEIREKR